jgi:hypothetical protein
LLADFKDCECEDPSANFTRLSRSKPIIAPASFSFVLVK